MIDESWSQGHVAGLADLDGDGVKELVTGKCVYAHTNGDPGIEDRRCLLLPPEQYDLQFHAAHHRRPRREHRSGRIAAGGPLSAERDGKPSRRTGFLYNP